MSQLSDIAGSGRTNVIPGYVLSQLQLPDYGFAEDAFARWYIQRVTLGARKATEAIQLKAIESAQKDITSGWLTFAMPGFDAMLKSAKGMELMTWLSLRIKHHDITRAKTRELIRAVDENLLARALLDMMGFTASRKKKRAPIASPPSPSTGTPSIPSSGSPPSEADAGSPGSSAAA